MFAVEQITRKLQVFLPYCERVREMERDREREVSATGGNSLFQTVHPQQIYIVLKEPVIHVIHTSRSVPIRSHATNRQRIISSSHETSLCITPIESLGIEGNLNRSMTLEHQNPEGKTGCNDIIIMYLIVP